MKRIVFAWFPAWPIERLLRQDPDVGLQGEPLALVTSARRGLVVAAVNAKAAAAGVHPGLALADARALLPALRARASEPQQDRRALKRLAVWCGRYGPGRNIHIGPPPGRDADDAVLDHAIWIDVTGVPHLFGGEAGLLDDLQRRLRGFGLSARLGLADTLGAAHALARCAPPSSHAAQSWVLAPPGQAAHALARLPVDALRLPRAAILTLKRLGLRRIGDLLDIPRSALERRFGDTAIAHGVLARLDQALGRLAEPCRTIVEPPQLAVRRSFPAPLVSADGFEGEVSQLLDELCGVLEARALGARRFRLVLYRADGTAAGLTVGTSMPVREAAHMMLLLADKLSRLDAGLGVDMLAVEVRDAERLDATERPLSSPFQSVMLAGSTALVDRLSNRLGPSRVLFLVPRASHIPERAEVLRPALESPPRDGAGWRAVGVSDRPPVLLRQPEPITVTAEVPDGAPVILTWRRMTRRIAHAEGPARLAPEWWRWLARTQPAADAANGRSGHSSPAEAAAALGEIVPRALVPQTRDYYRLEDVSGAGYWVFRSGAYGHDTEAGPPVWFMHGLFA